MPSAASKQNIRQLSITDLEHFFEANQMPRYRAAQVYQWLWQKQIDSLDKMTNIDKPTIARLQQQFELPALQLALQQQSEDGTFKTGFKTVDQFMVEGVLIPASGRLTACVSSQVGCSLSCKFCATGFMERKRNLNFDEIFDEVSLLNQLALKQHQHKLTNIVFMGMGEPLLNYQNVLQAIEKITSPKALAMSPKRITVSTSGIAKMIRQLGDDKVKFNLALSLHAPTDAKRSKIMSINDTNPIWLLIEALNYFYKQTQNDITYEYILFKDFNDTMEDADQLIKLYRQAPVSLVNLIEYNPIEKADYQKPLSSVTDAFLVRLIKNGVNAKIRRSRGKDIHAACGQLANKS